MGTLAKTVKFPKVAGSIALNVQRLATRRQHERPLAMPRLLLKSARPFVRGISAVYPGAREARGGANRIVIRSGKTAPPVGVFRQLKAS